MMRRLYDRPNNRRLVVTRVVDGPGSSGRAIFKNLILITLTSHIIWSNIANKIAEELVTSSQLSGLKPADVGSG